MTLEQVTSILKVYSSLRSFELDSTEQSKIIANYFIMAGQETTNTKDTAAVQGRFKSSLELLEHTLNCSNPECPLPHCVNMKLAMKHTQSCKKTQCQVCQRMKYLASKHTESCNEVYCCIPFCMEEKLKGFVGSQMAGCNILDDSQRYKRRVVADDEKDVCVTLNSSPSKIVREMSAPDRTFFSVNSSECKGGETADNHTAPTNVFLSPLKLGCDTHPPKLAKRGHPLVPPSSSASFVKSSRLRLEQSRSHSCAKETVTMTSTQFDASLKPLPASNREGPVTAKILKTFTPPLAEKVSAQEYAGAQQQGMSTILLDGIFRSCQATQAACTETHGETDQVNLSPFASDENVSNCSGPISKNVGDNPYDAIRGSQGSHGQAVLKARLMDALNKLLGLGLQRLETKEELVVCINSLRKAVEEIKALEVAEILAVWTMCLCQEPWSFIWFVCSPPLPLTRGYPLHCGKYSAAGRNGQSCGTLVRFRAVLHGTVV
ncbi:uncharacterized protein LOC111339501 [Stylophora pistillata]|uniref:uncharacterized protein LOC111339501 n=1 Tax=Stylophora pistillata TaxID=50429 RepID=UPI000C0543BE|nr:uncharacterized protein LOC111339501 [Stylophora pistillata]